MMMGGILRLACKKQDRKIKQIQCYRNFLAPQLYKHLFKNTKKSLEISKRINHKATKY